MESPTDIEAAFLALSNQYRRQILVALFDQPSRSQTGIDPMDAVTEEFLNGPELVALKLDLKHAQLPKLEEMRFIEYNEQLDEVSRGPEWDAIAPLLRILQEHQEELPEQWP